MTEFSDTFTQITVADIKKMAEDALSREARFVNVHVKRTKDGELILIYTFTEDEVHYESYTIPVTQEDEVPSISDYFPAAFFFENEAADLYGLKITDILIDFQGHFYGTAQPHPMALSPEEIDSSGVGRKHGIPDLARPHLDDASDHIPAIQEGE